MAKTRKKNAQPLTSGPVRSETQARPRPASPGSNRGTNRNTGRNVRRRATRQRRSLWFLIGGILLALLAVIGIFIYVGQQNQAPGASGPTDPEVLKAVTSIDPATLSTVGDGGVQPFLKATQNKPPVLTGANGKPKIFYSGAEFCPYCAGERWALVVALSRFGTFSALPQTTSASADTPPSLSTFSFYGSKYQSNYIDLDTVEQYTNKPQGNFYEPLQTPTNEQQQLIKTYNGPPYIEQQYAGGFPFVDIANQYLAIGPSFNVEVISNLSQKQIAENLSDSSSTVSKSILGVANTFTAAICKATNDQPTSVCKADPIPALQQALPKAQGSDQLAVAQAPEAILPRRED
jgi:hypothetical protein